jgi:hypothetical protein
MMLLEVALPRLGGAMFWNGLGAHCPSSPRSGAFVLFVTDVLYWGLTEDPPTIQQDQEEAGGPGFPEAGASQSEMVSWAVRAKGGLGLDTYLLPGSPHRRDPDFSAGSASQKGLLMALCGTSEPHGRVGSPELLQPGPAHGRC